MARTRTDPSRTEVPACSDFLSEDDRDEFDNIMLGNLCGDLMDEIVENDSCWGINPPPLAMEVT